MNKRSTSEADSNIPKLPRAQLGVGVRGKYLASYLAFAQEAKALTRKPNACTAKRRAV